MLGRSFKTGQRRSRAKILGSRAVAAVTLPAVVGSLPTTSKSERAFRQAAGPSRTGIYRLGRRGDCSPERNHAKFRLFEIARNEQRELVQQLNQTVRSTDEFRAAEAEGKLVRLPVSDGMALVFFNSAEAQVQCYN